MTVTEYMNNAILDIRKNYVNTGRKATGTFSTSLEWNVEEKGNSILYRILGANYSEFVENGRAKGKYPPRQAILDWIDAKGLVYDIPKNSLAFLIQRSIAKNGTIKRPEVIGSVITKQWALDLVRLSGAEKLNELKTEVLRSIKI